MSKQKLVIVTIVLAALGFTIATVFYNRNAKEQEPGIAASVPEEILVRNYSPVFGPKEAPVTIVEFFDPACEACRAFHPIVKKIRGEFPKKVRVVLRYTTFHKGSDEVVRILETARLQGVFEPVLEAVLESQPNWASHGTPNLNIAWEAAVAAGLNAEKAQRDRLMPDITGILNQDMEDVKKAGVDKTPTFFVNGKPLASFGAEQLYKLVREEVANARR